jgi:DNA-binding MarR family transcriptional regulator
VTREPNAEDARSLLVQLTGAGLALIEQPSKRTSKTNAGFCRPCRLRCWRTWTQPFPLLQALEGSPGGD